jgi:hypothetical protein
MAVIFSLATSIFLFWVGVVALGNGHAGGFVCVLLGAAYAIPVLKALSGEAKQCREADRLFLSQMIAAQADEKERKSRALSESLERQQSRRAEFERQREAATKLADEEKALRLSESEKLAWIAFHERKSLEEIDTMSGLDFERFVATLMQKVVTSRSS